MSRFMIVPCLFLMLGVRMPMAAETELDGGTAAGATGFGVGALVGGLVGGPIGAIVGAAGGAFVAEQDAAKDRTIDELAVKLNARRSELARLKRDLEQTQVALMGNAQILESTPHAPLGLAVYFRTDSADIDESLHPHLGQLAAYLKTFPELKVRLEGYSDRRGDSDYNLTLSQRRIGEIRRILEDQGIAPKRILGIAYGETRARAKPGDIDAMIFDRAVIIAIEDFDSTRA